VSGRIAVCANSMVPGSGAPSSAHGLRASGLRDGLVAAGFEVDIVSPVNSITAQLERWGTRRIAVPAHWRIVPDTGYETRLNADYEAVIFPNWPVARGFTKTGAVKVVYDFFSATLVEHACISGEAELAQKKAEKLALLAQADFVIANGAVQAAYAERFLAESAGRQVVDRVPAVRLSIPRSTDTAPPDGPLRIFFGGFLQAWTTGIRLADLERLADEQDSEVHAIGLGQHLHFRDMSRAGRYRPRTDRVKLHDVTSFESYQDLNASCHIALDIFEPNEERRVSYSTRAISSLACGCPLVTMAFTEVGRLVSETGAGWALERFCVEELRDLIVHLRANPHEMAAARERTEAFWQAHVAPRPQIEPLVRMLKTGQPNVR